MKYSKFLHFSLAIFLIATLIVSCKKNDLHTNSDAQLVENFLTAPGNISASLKAVIEEIKGQNGNQNFLPDFIRANGMPLWDKTVSNVAVLANGSTGISSRTAADDTTVYFIPFKELTKSEISAYVVCTKTDSKYSFKLYNKKALEKQTSNSNERKRFLLSALSVFAFFEKKINAKDSLLIEGIYNRRIYNAKITFGNTDTTINQTGRVAIYAYQITVYYEIDCPIVPPPQDPLPFRSSSAEPCYDSYTTWVYVWGTDSGGSGGTTWGGDGSGGGETTGGGTSSGEGDYRVINGITYTPDSYPGIEKGLVWLWWENSNLNTFVPASNLPPLNEPEYFKCFTNNSTSTYKITLAVDQPNGGTRDTYSRTGTGSSGSSGVVNVGHTFLILEQTLASGIRIIRNIGFYPVENVKPLLNPNSDGVMINDEFHEYDVSLTTTVTGNTFFQFLDILKNNSQEHYNLNTNNCSSYCINKLKQIGIDLPETIGSWPFGSGINPGDLGEDIRQMQLLPNQTRNNNGGNSPLNETIC